MARLTRLNWLLSGWFVLICGCSNQDADRLCKVGRKVSARLESAAGGSRGKMANSWLAMRGAMGEARLDCRVLVRLRWEQTLAESDIRVEMTAPGVVKLLGSVNNFQERRRAIEVANSTVGVKQVDDELTVLVPTP
jgi:osmotically-inducible protein OsmY